MDEGLSEVCVRREADKFRDYWHGASGKTAAKLDWQATWRNWVRKAVDDRGKRQISSEPKPGDQRTLPDGRIQEFVNNYDRWMTVVNA